MIIVPWGGQRAAVMTCWAAESNLSWPSPSDLRYGFRPGSTWNTAVNLHAHPRRGAAYDLLPANDIILNNRLNSRRNPASLLILLHKHINTIHTEHSSSPGALVAYAPLNEGRIPLWRAWLHALHPRALARDLNHAYAALSRAPQPSLRDPAMVQLNSETVRIMSVVNVKMLK